LLAVGLLGAVIGGYLIALLFTAPAGALAPQSAPAAADPEAVAVPPPGQFQQAVTIAERFAGAVAVKAEAENGAGVYEVKVVKGDTEIKLHVNVRTQQVVELEREVENPLHEND
jgi:hypothetical protein